MAIRTIVHMARNGCSDAGRETALQILTNQSNSLSAGHAGPLKYLPPWILEHERLQLDYTGTNQSRASEINHLRKGDHAVLGQAR